MKIIVKNNIVIKNPTQKVYEWVFLNLVVENPEYNQKKRLGKYIGRTPKELKLYYENDEDLILPFGCFEDVYKLHNYNNDYINKINAFKSINIKSSIKLSDYQESAVETLKNAKNGVLQAPCGSGKTIMGLELIKRVGGKALWLTHTHKLLEQSRERAKHFLEGDFGVITDGKVKIGKDITFATIQTMANLDPSIYKDEFSVIVVDECHHVVGTPTKMTQFYKVVNNCNCRFKYGLSATLTRQDGLIDCVFRLLGSIKYTISEKQVEERVVKASYRPIFLDFKYNRNDYIQADGTLVYNDLINMLCESEQRNDFIVDFVNELKKTRKKIMVLVPRVQQCKVLASMIDDCNCVHGSAKDKDMSKQVIVATFQIAKEGLDLPNLDTLLLTAPIKDEIAVKQSVGRVERKYDGKLEPLVFDLVDDLPYCKSAYTKRRRILHK